MPRQIRNAFACLLTAAALLGVGAASSAKSGDTGDFGTAPKDFSFQSAHLGAAITLKRGVFAPFEAETYMLPFMQENAKLFDGKEVMEIGTGTGIISLYAAKLGATRVVSTDILPEAIAGATENAENLS